MSIVVLQKIGNNLSNNREMIKYSETGTTLQRASWKTWGEMIYFMLT